jgi:hypothetical protein
MFTSNYRTAGNHPDAVAISKGKPFVFDGRRYAALEPTAEQRKLKGDAFRASYNASLERLDAAKVYADLGENAILLCWEAPGDFCHRRLVADWLKAELGVDVQEWKNDEPMTPVIPLGFYPPKQKTVKPNPQLGLFAEA